MLLSNNYGEMKDLRKSVIHDATTVGMRINALKAQAISALIFGEHHQAALVDGEPLEDVGKFMHFGSMSIY